VFLKIVVLIKQVPATENVKINPETGVMMREGLDVEVNPLDLHAIEEAVRFKEKFPGVRVTAVTMGPPAAAKAVRYAIAMGCDEGVVVTDKAFAGSDTLATSRVLADVMHKLEPDLILTGERATDGETGQVGPSVGSLLGVSVLTYVSKLEMKDDKLVVERAVEGGHERLMAPLPALAVVVKEINVPRLCTLSGKIRGKKADISVLSFNALSIFLRDDRVGLAGSPTKVVKVGYPQVTRKGRKISASEDFDKAVNELALFVSDLSELKVEGV
jgi:electron transfer flavoprotein beta subunit